MTGEARRRLIASTNALVGETILIFPSTPFTAPEVAPLERDQAEFLKVNLRTMKNTMPGNFLDWCGVSVPCGTDASGLPVWRRDENLDLTGLPIWASA